MPYNKETEATVIISKKHHAMLKALAQKHKRKLRAMNEVIIEQIYEQEKENTIVVTKIAETADE